MTTLSIQKLSPAQEQARRLQIAFDIFNRQLFDNQLPPTMLRLERQKNSHGYYAPNKFVDADGNRLDSITLNSTDAAERPLIELLSTLVHEMCHQFICRVVNEGAATGGHGVEWRKEMTEMGLPPIRIGATWRMATHSINDQGMFARCFEAYRDELERLPWQELARDAAKGRATGLDKVRFQCPSCNSKAWARASAELLCGTCSSTAGLVEMIPEVRAEGGSGSGGANRAHAVRTDYPEPSTSPALPVFTDDIGRELRLHTGIDHPPQSKIDALIVLLFGVSTREPQLIDDLCNACSFMTSGSEELYKKALKAIWKHRASVLHPDRENGSEIGFKSLQVAYRMWQQRNGKPYYAREEDVRTAAQ